MLLQKVALIAGRLGSIIEVLPKMHIVHLVRHPYQSIPSLVSMFNVPWKRMAPQALRNSQANLEVVKMVFEYYRYLLELKKRLPKGKIIEVRYEDLVNDQKETVEKLYRRLDLEMSDEYRAILEAETEKARRCKIWDLKPGSRSTDRLRKVGFTTIARNPFEAYFNTACSAKNYERQCRIDLLHIL